MADTVGPAILARLVAIAAAQAGVTGCDRMRADRLIAGAELPRYALFDGGEESVPVSSGQVRPGQGLMIWRMKPALVYYVRLAGVAEASRGSTIEAAWGALLSSIRTDEVDGTPGRLGALLAPHGAIEGAQYEAELSSPINPEFGGFRVEFDIRYRKS